MPNNTLYLLLLILAGLMLFPLARNAWLKHQRKRKYQSILNTLQRLYANTNPFDVAKQARNTNTTENVYGEIHPVALLDLLAKIPPQKGLCYDLGSGDGKAMLAIKLCYPQLSVIGIEQVSQLHNIAQQKYHEYLKQHSLKAADFMLTHLQEDFSEFSFIDADILFINATALDTSWPQILSKLRQLKPGARIIITTKTLPDDTFAKLYEGMEQMSWGLASTYIYEKKSESN